MDRASRVAFDRGGRGARDRIVASARVLFYRDGIHATGVDQLAEHAHVSKRTLYKHFSSKEDIVAAYLRDADANRAVPRERALDKPGLAPRDRLLAVFERGKEKLVRGCPYHNAAVEAAGKLPEVHGIVRAHKDAFIARLIDTCAEVGVNDASLLGNQLAVLFEGAVALATTLNDTAPMVYAQSAAAILIDEAARGPEDRH
ncbi:TetR/AcrR family transcriptional regulator [Mycobacterium colombiense]|uniref:TetR/AcrR family transcriptional regulator n=1 Tax=Mycobacterium colombiense TaxID=339268 RepID=A0A329KVJ1_9MYCO|nr:TetR/AcrR family transcriptional regulator [Mycobacterium colombiense]RAU99400.1 TetR/AcrR family transcriptional regulator [Mycobacterium colombiense]